MRVLLVEDDAVAAQGLALTLKAMHAAIDHVDNGEQALDLVRRYNYDIVMLDLMLSDIDGHEVVRRMRADGIDTPVLMLSRDGAACGQGPSVAVSSDIGNPSGGDTENPATSATVTLRLMPVRVSL